MEERLETVKAGWKRKITQDFTPTTLTGTLELKFQKPACWRWKKKQQQQESLVVADHRWNLIRMIHLTQRWNSINSQLSWTAHRWHVLIRPHRLNTRQYWFGTSRSVSQVTTSWEIRLHSSFKCCPPWITTTHLGIQINLQHSFNPGKFNLNL